MRIDRLAEDAYGNEKWAEAEAFALEGLRMAESFPSNWNYGNVIHHSNQVVGLIRLQKGEREPVLEYVELVRQFWAQESVHFPEIGREHNRLIKQWKDIKASNLPQHRLWSYDL